MSKRDPRLKEQESLGLTSLRELQATPRSRTLLLPKKATRSRLSVSENRVPKPQVSLRQVRALR